MGVKAKFSILYQGQEEAGGVEGDMAREDLWRARGADKPFVEIKLAVQVLPQPPSHSPFLQVLTCNQLPSPHPT